MNMQLFTEKAAIAALCSLALGWAQAGSESMYVTDGPTVESTEVRLVADLGSASNDGQRWAQAFGMVTQIEALGSAAATDRVAMPKPGSDLPAAQPAGGYRVTVRMDSGSVISVQQASIGSLVNGSRVKLVGGTIVSV